MCSAQPSNERQPHALPVAHTFRKPERMVSQKQIDSLFASGGSRSLAAYPLRVVYVLAARQPGSAPVTVLISVPKRRFKHAVDRNRVKRQVREAYRQHKQLLYDVLPDDKQLLVAYVWLSDRHAPTDAVEARVKNLMRRMAETL